MNRTLEQFSAFQGIPQHYLDTIRLYAALETRSVADVVPAKQLDLETRFADALYKALEAFYSAPFHQGYGDIPETSESAIVDWLKGEYGDNPQWASHIISVMLPFLRQGLKSGIEQGLELLNAPVDGVVVSNEELLADVADRASSLMTIDSTVSLTNTTINDLGRTLFKAVVNDIAFGVALAAMAAHIQARSILIAEYETSRVVSIGMVETYQRNGVVHMIYNIRDSDACNICTPDDGKQFLIKPSLWLPRHNHCRCYFTPDTTNWNPPKEWWQGT